MGKRKSRGEPKKGPDLEAVAAADASRTQSDEPKLPEARGADKVPQELATAYTELAQLDSVLAGGYTLGTWLEGALKPHLDPAAPHLDADGIGPLVDAVESVRSGLGTARQHVATIRAEIALLRARFVSAPSRTVSLSAIMGRLAALTDTDLDIVARMTMHLAARSPMRASG